MPFFILTSLLINKCHRLCGLILLVCCSFFIQAQTTGDWYLSKILNDNNGLPQNSIRSMYYDKKTDFLWLATEAGLLRYDGANAKVFDSRDMPSLGSTRIFNFFPTLSGQIIGCNNLGETFTLHKNAIVVNKLHRAATVQSIGFRKGNIKSMDALLIENDALRKEPGNPVVVYNRTWINDSIWITDTDSSVCLARNNHVLYHWPKMKNSLTSYIVRDRLVYIINNVGKGYCIDIVNRQLVKITIKSKIFSSGNLIFFYDIINDRPLLVNNNEIHEVIFNNAVISTRLVAVLPKLPTYITSLVFDKSGNYLFVATNATGLYIYHLSSFKLYKAVGDDVINNNYGCVLIDSNHMLTNRSVLFNLANGESKWLPFVIAGQSMGMDTSHNIWHGNYWKYVSSVNVNHPENVIAAPSTGMDIFQTAFLSATGRLWVSTGQYFGYAKGLDVKRLIHYKNVNYSFSYITETPAGKLLGVNAHGIYCIDIIHNVIIPVLTDTFVSQIRNIYIDSSYRCWIGTYGRGIFLYHLNTKKLTRLPLDDKGYLQYSHAFIDDGLGNFLVPTNKGLFRLSKSNLLQIDAGTTTPLYYQYFDVGDGLVTNEFNGGCQPAYNRLPNGDILLPALQGLVRVKVNELPNPGNHPLYIDKIETKYNVYSFVDTIRFRKEERLQNWNLCFAQWDHPNTQGVFYRIDDDTVWQRLPAGEKKIQLNELTGGNHRLEIRHQYGLQPGRFTSASYQFYINKYYYETIWFWLLLLLLLAGVMYTTVRLRSRQLKQKNVQLQQIIRGNTQDLSDKNVQLEETLMDLREALKGLRENSVFKDRLIGLIGHDMLLPLRFIARIATHLYDEAEVLSPAIAKENGNEIKNTVTELLYLGESLVQWIKLQEGRFRLIIKLIELRQLAEEMMEVHKPMAAVKNNHLICAVAAGIFCRYDAVFLKIIFHNLLLNANKFTEDGSITVDALIQKDELHCKVYDTGTGMSHSMTESLNKGITVPSQLGTNKEAGWGMGYLLIIDLLRFAGGRLHIESEPGKWTSVQFILPLTIEEER